MWAGECARLKDGCRRPEATARELTLGPTASTRSRAPPPLLTMKPVSRRTLDWIYSVVGLGLVGLQCRLPRSAIRGPVCIQHPETPKPISELSVSLPPPDSASSWRTRSSASYVRVAGTLASGTLGWRLKFPSRGPLATSGAEPRTSILPFGSLPPPLPTVAARGRPTLLGICHLCIHCSCATAAGEAVPGPDLRDERICLILLGLVLCKVLFLILV